MTGHSEPDRLKAGESLEAGDCLISADGRFRLYMEEYGFLALYAYAIGVGRVRLWPSENADEGPGIFTDNAGTGIRLHLRDDNGGNPQLYVLNASGQMRWRALQDAIVAQPELVLQSDGNLVLLQGVGQGGVGWATGTNKYLPQYESTVINPTIPSLAIKYGQIAIDVDPASGDGGVYENPLGIPVGIRDSQIYVTLPPLGGKVAGKTSPLYGTVEVTTEAYVFPPLSATEDPAGVGGNIVPGPVGTPGPHQSADAVPIDAIPVNPTNPHVAQIDAHGKFHLIIGQNDTGLYMTDSHSHSAGEQFSK